MKTNLKKLMILIVASLTFACEKNERTFSLLEESDSYITAANYQQRQIDVLWVVDNSGSMQTSQESLARNFNSFIQRFQSLNYDFHMAVTSTDAWLGKYKQDTDLKGLYLGLRGWGAQPKNAHHACQQVLSGVPIMNRSTENLSNVFVTNAQQSTCGTGDERAFESIIDVLDYNSNSDFRRPNAFLAIIIVSDEDDFSSLSEKYYSAEGGVENDYESPALLKVGHFKQALDQRAGALNYSVNTISILDQTCLAALNNEFSGRKIGNRYVELSTESGGIMASICDDFSNSLTLISDSIIELASSFTLDRQPVIETIQVFMNNSLVPNDQVDGWTYDSSSNKVQLHGSYLPAENDQISIKYDPIEQKF